VLTLDLRNIGFNTNVLNIELAKPQSNRSMNHRQCRFTVQPVEPSNSIHKALVYTTKFIQKETHTDLFVEGKRLV
jgi:hypothetical protein